MRNRATRIFATAVLICLLPAAGLALTPYSQDFESLNQSNPYALTNDNWLVYGNVFEPDGVTYIRGYGPYPAPNDGFGFCQIALDEGGVEQGSKQLTSFSDYNNFNDHDIGNIIESNVYQEQIIGAENVGETWAFYFDAKRGNLEGGSTAAAFIKTLDPGAGYALTNLITADMTTTPIEWNYFALAIEIDASLEGQLLQIGFLNMATNFEGSGVFYDNIDFHVYDPTSGVPSSPVGSGATLRQNYPNPFNPATRIEFVLDRPGNVELFLFDLAGRRIATLQQGELGAGEHAVTWNGMTDKGSAAPAGQYRYVLRTATGQVARSMVLLK